MGLPVGRCLACSSGGAHVRRVAMLVGWLLQTRGARTGQFRAFSSAPALGVVTLLARAASGFALRLVFSRAFYRRVLRSTGCLTRA